MVGLLFIVLAGLGGGISFAYRFIPSGGPIPGWALNLAAGGAAGCLLAGGALVIWKRTYEALEKEGVERRLINSFLCGLLASIIGGILALATGLLLPAGAGERIIQGGILIGALALGLTAGYSLDRPLLRGGLAEGLRSSLRKKGMGSSKILDTSAIIDGRIGDLLQTGFLEGAILLPEFILAELQNVADSSNSLRRRKGRRGLEVLRKLQSDESVAISIVTQDYPSIKEVDHKLLRLAKDRGAVLITTDYNLNRVAQVEGVKVLNINELVNAVKPRFIPGEAIDIDVIDRGEAIDQGIGYLDDGTMVVVANGRRHIGTKIKVIVKNTLQTEAGKMLFVEPSGESPRWEQQEGG